MATVGRRNLFMLGTAAAILLLGGAVSAHAAIIYGTGTAGPSQRDSNWRVVGLPTDWGAAPATPYDAYVFQKGGINWYGGEAFGTAQTGYTNANGTVYWIGIQASPGSVLPFPTAWHWIVAQTFTVEQAGMYSLTFPAFSDELLDVYVNGTVTSAPLLPTVSGGTLVTSGYASNGVNFTTVTTVTGSAYLNSGTNTIYAQIRDSGFSTGVMIGEVTLAAVPEPSAMVMAVVGLTGGACLLWRRRRQA
jgi:hypothetical protein